ncbi:MAG: dihydrofolate reductase [Hyphomicrobiaceae bacterium]
MTDTLTGYKITLVVAAARNGVIGRSGDMPWRMPSSLRRFRALTLGRPMIMGRKTFEAIGRPLDGRDTIVVTRDPKYSSPGIHTAPNLDTALQIAKRLAVARATNEIIIAGGGEIYRAALAVATHVHLDLIDATPDGDTTFPPLPPDEWHEQSRESVEPHANDQYPMTAISYCRSG